MKIGMTVKSHLRIVVAVLLLSFPCFGQDALRFAGRLAALDPSDRLDQESYDRISRASPDQEFEVFAIFPTGERQLLRIGLDKVYFSRMQKGGEVETLESEIPEELLGTMRIVFEQFLDEGLIEELRGVFDSDVYEIKWNHESGSAKYAQAKSPISSRVHSFIEALVRLGRLPLFEGVDARMMEFDAVYSEMERLQVEYTLLLEGPENFH
jgi:hypothetical protein